MLAQAVLPWDRYGSAGQKSYRISEVPAGSTPHSIPVIVVAGPSLDRYWRWSRFAWHGVRFDHRTGKGDPVAYPAQVSGTVIILPLVNIRR